MQTSQNQKGLFHKAKQKAAGYQKYLTLEKQSKTMDK